MSESGITARLAELTGPRQLAFREEPLRAPDSGEVQARTIRTAISTGTEMAAYLGLPPLRPGKIYPRLVGYCNVAEIVACGTEVQDFGVGDRILTHQSHRSAFVCSAEEILLKLPEGTDPNIAATTYLFHLGYNALLKGGFQAGQEVTVIGLGTLGLGAVALAAALDCRVAAFSNQSVQRERAVRIGAIRSFGKTVADPDERAQSGYEGAELVITTSNHWKDWQLALEVARTDAAICVIGFPGRGEPAPDFNPLDSQYFYDKQLRLLACGKAPVSPPANDPARFNVKRNCQFLLDLILAGKLPADELIADEFPAAELPLIYERLAGRSPGEMTCILNWTEA